MVTENGPAPMSLHTVSFAGWWDPSGPGSPYRVYLPPSGLTFDAPAYAVASDARRRGRRCGGDESRPMRGQYALHRSDGSRWGIKDPNAD